MGLVGVQSVVPLARRFERPRVNAVSTLPLRNPAMAQYCINTNVKLHEKHGR